MLNVPRGTMKTEVIMVLISVSHRLRDPKSNNQDSTKRDQAIIVKFVRRDIRDAFYKAISQLRNKSTRDLGIGKTFCTENLYSGEPYTKKPSTVQSLFTEEERTRL